jgi:hypothetical protein
MGTAYTDKIFETCLDDVHPNWPFEGGELDLVKSRYSFRDAYVSGNECGQYIYPRYCTVYVNGWPKTTVGYKSIEYLGRIRCYPPTWGTASSNLALAASYGAQGWNRYKPAQPVVNLSVFLYEIAEVTKLFKFALSSVKKIASSYLNIQFGWLPTLGELENLLDAASNMSELINQLIRDNGQWVHRAGSVAKEKEVIGPKSIYGSIYPYIYTSGLKTTQETRVNTRISFAGRFKYYIPALANNTLSGRIRAARRVLGLEGITPANIWEIIPFSWMIDYFSNLGDIISNFESSIGDNLVAKYAYSMAHTKIVVENTATFFVNYSGKTTSKVAIARLIKESKARAVANPFGFSSDTDLSWKQLSILVALGLSR